MRVLFHDNSINYNIGGQTGYGMGGGGGFAPSFAGVRRMRGGGFLGTAFNLFRNYAFPVIKKMFMPTMRVISNTQDKIKKDKLSIGQALKSSIGQELRGEGLGRFTPGIKRKAIVLGSVKKKSTKKRRKTKRQVLM